MTDPVSSSALSQGVESLSQQAGGVDGAEKTGSNTDFSRAMAQDGGGVDAPGGVDEAMDPHTVEDIDAIEPAAEIPTDDFVQRMLDEESDIQAMMDKCINGSDMSQQEMLQMQAVIYSYSQRVDLTTKVVENATSGIKDVMNTQV